MKFRLGINYWPASKAMDWWQRFEADEVRADFGQIRAAGFDSVRIFLLWEDFQPEPECVSERALRSLMDVANAAAAQQLSVLVTFFVGHMSGVNWIPPWALEAGRPSNRFRTIANGRIVRAAPRNWYSDSPILRAQALLAREVAGLLRAHPALWAYDLGNENSNCMQPPSRDSAVAWLETIAGAIRSVDSHHPITLGLHLEDLEEDRRLGPQEAAQVCDFLCMHGYPMYARWAGSAEDERLLPFLGLVTRWLGGRDVLFEEFGAPAVRSIESGASALVLEEQQAARFTRRALDALHRFGFPGALVWCFSDYAPSLWNRPPLDEAPHERHFGLWRSDGSAKPALAEIQRFVGAGRLQSPERLDWIDISPHEFYRDPSANLRRLYRKFCECYAEEEVPCPR
ncbi:MAG TPA: hypothetical protein VNN17_03405 [Terriglobia bacterium]|nr:hypothetical protein [Terriglobia bacterium]